jgi:hypothetical protein
MNEMKPSRSRLRRKRQAMVRSVAEGKRLMVFLPSPRACGEKVPEGRMRGFAESQQ